MPHIIRALFVVGCVIEKVPRKTSWIQRDDALEKARLATYELKPSTPIFDVVQKKSIRFLIGKIVGTDE